jgi:outer membrane protein assembly factor BamD
MKKSLWIVVLVMLVVASSCSSRLAKLERSNDFDELYKGAITYYEQGKYSRAKLLFERMTPYYRGTLEAEKIKFYWAYAEYHSGFYELSAFHFKDFYQTYGRSVWAEEAEYMHAYSLYRNSPDVNLDQSSSEEAIIAMQNFLNRRPNTTYFQEATTIVSEMQVRFETKAYNTAKLYYKLTSGTSYRSYLEAALVTFDTFKTDFPDSQFNEELMFLSIETSYKLAANSLERLQDPRYKRTLTYYNSFAARFPNSEYMPRAIDMFDKTQTELKELNISY